MTGAPGPVDELFGAIDSLDGSGGLAGWVLSARDGRPAAGVRLELRQDGRVLLEAAPDMPRPDVSADSGVDLGFSMRVAGLAALDALLDGAASVVAIDRAGNELVLEIYAPVLARMREERAAALHREHEAGLAHAARAAQAGRAARVEARTPRIVFIGAGSTVFARNLLGDILGEPALAASRICLYDIDPERLRVSTVVAERIVRTLEVPARIESTTDLGRALDGADYAINMIQVGGYRPCTVTDFEIPNRFGLRQTIGDTLGIGGIMRALRTIPVLLDMTAEMERRCPDVLHLNYVNPMAMNCAALHRAGRIRTVGLCHSVQGTAAELARDIGVPLHEIDYQVAGINHMAFFLRFQRQGQDLYPLIRRVAEENRVPAHNRVRYDLLKRFGYFVTESSEHVAEYVPWYIKQSRKELIGRLSIPLDEYPRRCELQIADWAEQARVLQDPARPLDVTRSNEYGSHIIHAIETGRPAVVYGNVSNDGLIDNLPAEACVEVPCLVDGTGLHPVRIGRLPPQLAALMQTNVNVQTLAVEAALTGRREHVYHAAMLDPHTAAELDLDQIVRLVDELLSAHRAWLPDALLA